MCVNIFFLLIIWYVHFECAAVDAEACKNSVGAVLHMRILSNEDKKRSCVPVIQVPKPRGGRHDCSERAGPRTRAVLSALALHIVILLPRSCANLGSMVSLQCILFFWYLQPIHFKLCSPELKKL